MERMTLGRTGVMAHRRSLHAAVVGQLAAEAGVDLISLALGSARLIPR